jgi:two-component system, sensor histidine kinase and response regulator
MDKLQVLVVDDEPGIRSGIERILRNYSIGYPFLDEDFEFDILEAETGEKAIEIINNRNVDIVLLDNKLPGMDGIDVLHYLSNGNYDAEVMMITSYASLELAVKATNYGAFNFVPKPFTPQELKAAMEAITKHLFLKRMTRTMREEGRQIRFQFLSVLSHELKSPINAIEGYMQIMKERQAGNELASYDVMIERSIERLKGMRNLIMDLLDLTKLESGKKQREIQKFDLWEIIKVARDTIEPMAIQRNVKIHMDNGEDCMVKADPREMEIILNNLISNAVKYNRENGEVRICLKKQSGCVCLVVEDTGIGLSEEDQKILFQEFARVRNEKTQYISGSGLGLSIVKKLTDMYSGNIGVESRPDQGSKFTVQLPILAE